MQRTSGVTRELAHSMAPRVFGHAPPLSGPRPPRPWPPRRPATDNPEDTSKVDVDSRTADGYDEVRGFSPVDPRGRLLGYIVRTPAGLQALDPDGKPLGSYGDDVAAAKRAVEQAAPPRPARG